MTATSERPKPATRAEQARQTQQGILDAALRLFAQHGYDATSLQDIADELHLTKAAVYYHFRTKAEILLAIAEPLYASMSSVMDDAARLRTRRQRLDAMIRGSVEVMLSHRAVMSVVNNDPAMHIQMKAARTMDDLQSRAIEILYGDSPTPDQRLAIAAVTGLADAISTLPELTDDEIRPLLVRAIKRLIPEH